MISTGKLTTTGYRKAGHLIQHRVKFEHRYLQAFLRSVARKEFLCEISPPSRIV